MMKTHFFIAVFFLIGCSGSRQLSLYSSSDLNLSARKPVHQITFHKRMNMFDMARKLQTEGIMSGRDFLNVTMDDEVTFLLLRKRFESLEGYLYPGTYRVSQDMKVIDLVEKMVQRFSDVYSKVSVYSNLKWPRHQVVTLASMIEKEALQHREKPVISSVFVNRLNLGMKLQSDPTVYYGVLRNTGKQSNQIGRAGFKMDTIYNTYTREGFPAGPISNPDSHSLRAVFHPKKTNYFYFVSRNDGTHAFNITFQEHLKDVEFYQR